jgi:predicted ATPase
VLIEFRVANHRSVRDEQVLTFESGRPIDKSDGRPRRIEGHLSRILPVAVLYGANASGKSNVLGALAFMREAVIESHRSWPPEEGVPREPFAWGPSNAAPSLFEVTLLLDGVRYQYGFVSSDERFLEEWLYAWPKGKKQIWFERDGDKFKFRERFKGENKLIEEVTRPNALFLSAAVQHRHEQLRPLYTWFRSLEPINLNRRASAPRQIISEMTVARLLESTNLRNSHQQKLFDEPDDTTILLERFRDLLRSADVGIVDLKADRSTADSTHRRLGVPQISLKHTCQYPDSWLALQEESKGTRTLFNIGLPILQAVERGGMVVVDELEASLHPSLAMQLVSQFNLPSSNPKNAQLLFTTHDTNLLGTTLGEPVLRRDQVWLTEKGPDGASILYPLTDFKPRKEENLERGYLQGRYGAIPFLGNLSLSGDKQ